MYSKLITPQSGALHHGASQGARAGHSCCCHSPPRTLSDGGAAASSRPARKCAASRHSAAELPGRRY